MGRMRASAGAVMPRLKNRLRASRFSQRSGRAIGRSTSTIRITRTPSQSFSTSWFQLSSNNRLSRSFQV